MSCRIINPLSHCYFVLLNLLSTANLASLCSAANFVFDNTSSVLPTKLEMYPFNDFNLRCDFGCGMDPVFC